jgi:UDP-N-acetylglucosamine--N-acetylmuramyl-(pentapeptide) pyrophosphoryl-undecaprenol N-acetylglucosamine transferase
MRAAGAASVIPDAELSAERLQAEVGGAIENPGRLEAMASAARTLAKPDAARRIADQVLEAAK